jgi:PKD repeat protein
LGAAVTLALPLIAFPSVLAAPAYAVTCQSGTPTPTDSYPGSVVMANNFESGTLDGFTVNTGGTGTATVSSAQAHDGACSAYLHVTTDPGSLANFSTALPSGTQQVYADGWFNITVAGVAGNDVPYFRFFNGSTRYVDVYRDNDNGVLWVRFLAPDGTYNSTSLGRTVPLNTWHRLVMHVIPNGSATTVEIWFDGTNVYSSTQVNLTTSLLDRVQNGAEHVQQMGDEYIDGLIIKSVTNAPVPSFTASPSSGTAPLAVAFTDTSIGTPTSWSWNFGDGSTSTLQNPTHTYSTAGTYTVTLTATNANGSNSTSSTITVKAATASFTATPTSGVVPMSVAFKDTSTGSPTAWAWNFGDGTTSTLQNPTHTYSTAGTYTATLTTTYSQGSTSSATAVITAQTLAQAMDAKAAQWNLGAATSDVTPIRDGGYYRNYQSGAIISTPWHSLFVSRGAIRSEWAALAYENGLMGYPTTDEVGGLVNGGVYQNYEGGAIVWTYATGAHESFGPIRQVWQQLGFEGGVLGYPTTEVVTGLINGGSYQNYQGGAIVSSPAAGTHESVGPIRSEWQATGFERGILGYPTTGVVTGLVNGGSYQNYQSGAIVSSPTAGTHESFGPIRAEWQSTGFEGGVLGYPTTEVVSGLINGGSYQNYQGGAIVSSPASGTHESIGAIRKEWASTGYERGILGYPTTEVVTGLVNGGSYQNYQGGAIVSSPTAGTHESYGPIRAAWMSAGFEKGALGYPTSEVYAVPNGTAQDFQGGRITDINGTTTITYSSGTTAPAG